MSSRRLCGKTQAQQRNGGNYKGYEIERVTRNTYVIRKGGEEVAMPGCYPKTYKAAKVIIDNLAK